MRINSEGMMCINQLYEDERGDNYIDICTAADWTIRPTKRQESKKGLK